VPNPQAASGVSMARSLKSLHIDADSFVVAVDAGPVRGFASHAGAAHRGEDRGDDLVAQGEQGGGGACGGCPDVVARARPGLSTSCLPRSLRRS